MTYEYQIIRIKFKNIITGKIDVNEVETSLNQYGINGFRLKSIDGISKYWNLYLEKRVGESAISYKYLVSDPDDQSKYSGNTPTDQNTLYLTGLGLEGWRLHLVKSLGSISYFFLEKTI